MRIRRRCRNLLADVPDLLIPGALTYIFGKMVGTRGRAGRSSRRCRSCSWSASSSAIGPNRPGIRSWPSLGVETAATAGQSGGNMEGKEVRFGIANSALFATVTTDASCGAVIGMHDSFTPIGGLVPLFNMQTDEVIFGGVGAGLYSMLIYCILAVFIGGLMVGRTPEYVGKKIEQKEVKMAMIAMLATAFSILGFTALSSVIHFPAKGLLESARCRRPRNLNNSGPHGFSRNPLRLRSGTGNNGSAFAGISANTPWYNLTIGLAMLDRPIPVHDSACWRPPEAWRRRS